MQNPEMDIQKQQRMLLRGIANIRSLAQKALASGLIADFIPLENSNRDFKAYVATHVTAPEILAYTARIPSIDPGEEPGLGRIMFMSFFSAMFGRHDRARRSTIREANEVMAMYGNLELLVGMMDGE